MTRMTGSALAGAAALLTTAVQVSPASAQLAAQVAWCGNLTHKFSVAMQIGGCTTLIDSGKMADKPLAWSHANRGTAYENKGDHAHAIADFDTAIKLDPKSPDALTGRCAARAEVGSDLPQALADCDASLAIRGKDAGTLNSRGFTYLRLGQFDEAIADYNAALKINARLASALYGRGLAKQKKGDTVGGQVDRATANLVQSDIADEFAGYGVK
jgi:tetratricopeptide (TPR) repeat protein